MIDIDAETKFGHSKKLSRVNGCRAHGQSPMFQNRTDGKENITFMLGVGDGDMMPLCLFGQTVVIVDEIQKLVNVAVFDAPYVELFFEQSVKCQLSTEYTIEDDNVIRRIAAPHIDGFFGVIRFLEDDRRPRPI